MIFIQIFIKKYIQSLKKADTKLAFLVSAILYYNDSGNIIASILHAIKFVLIFLLILNILFQ